MTRHGDDLFSRGTRPTDSQGQGRISAVMPYAKGITSYDSIYVMYYRSEIISRGHGVEQTHDGGVTQELERISAKCGLKIRMGGNRIRQASSW